MKPDIEIRDLRSYSGQQLKPLLQTEARAWRERLLWDYSASVDLVMRYLDARILPGLVALRNGKIAGYCFSVYEGQKAVIGDVFSMPGDGSVDVDCALVQSVVETLQNTPGVDRIESQLLLHGTGPMLEVYREAGFEAYRRAFMEAPLDPAGLAPIADVDLPPGIKLVRWSNAHFQVAGELIHRAYVGHGDSVINDQYHSIHGSLRFLHNIVRFPGCGVFDAEGSLALWDERRGVMEGILLCSVVDKGVGHITQICIAPHLRGRQLGSLMLQTAMAGLSRRGFRAITLTVTQANAPAMKLYAENGFTERLGFDAEVWQRKTPLPI